MSGLAFLFPGQGSQRVGMGGDLTGSDAERLRDRLATAAEHAGIDLAGLCAHGPAEGLMRTEAAQPALLALSVTLAEMAGELGLRPRAVAGHSLGEYSAAVAAGALSAGDGLRLVCARGRLMGEAQASRPGAMAAVLGAPAEQVAELCGRVARGRTLVPANLNSPVQTVVSGDAAAVDELVTLAAGGGEPRVRAVRLPVGAAFHSPLMDATRRRLEPVMAGLAWRPPAVPLASNVSGDFVTTADGVREALLEQITAPVRWVACVRRLAAAGCTSFVELGPGTVLAVLVRKVLPDARVASVQSRAQLEALARSSEA